MSCIGEIDTSSPETSGADSTVIADRYEKIAGLIIPPKALEKFRHASHVCQQGAIRQERHRTKIDQIRKESQARYPSVSTKIDPEKENRGNHDPLVCPQRFIHKGKIKASTISSCAYKHRSDKKVQ